MASSAEIGASSSSYVGNENLGGGSFGSFQINTKPIEDLARYTMLYNKSEYDQRQKDAERAAAEIADVTSYDLTTGIPKDAKILQDKYDKLTAYVRDNPNALDYKNKKEWTEYNKMRNDLDNDLKGAKVRNTMWALRQKEIQDQTNPETRKLMQAELDKEIAATDIRTPINHSQQFQDNTVKLPSAPELTFDVTKTGPNAVVGRTYSYFNVPKARANGDVFALGLDKAIDPSTPQGQRDQIANKNNFWLQGAEAFNSVINAADPITGGPLYKKEVVDVNGNKSYVIDESKLSKLPRNLLNLVKQTNEYLAETKADIKAGVLRDKFEKPITFGEGALDENDYQEINYQDGISPEELALIAQFAAWKGDNYATKVQQTDNAIQVRGQDVQAATTRRGQDMENARFWAGYNKSSQEDVLSADAVIREVSDAINSGVPHVVKDKKTGKSINTVAIADPNLLKEFGTIDKDGTTTNVPDIIHFNKDSNKLSLVYYKKDGTDVEMENGNPVVDKQVELLPTQWLGQVTKRKNPNKDIGGVNTLIDQVYNKYGRDLQKLAEEYQGGAVITTDKKTTENGKAGSSSSDPDANLTDAEYYKKNGKFRNK